MSFNRLREAVHGASERIQEIRYGIRTIDLISEQALGFTPGDGRVHYTPLPYAALKELLSVVTPNPQKDVFVDWGAGLGRVLVLASTCPYRQVLGVECSPDLCAAAERNLQHARVKRRCGEVRMIHADAREFPIPEDASVMFFYNPFRGELLTDVVRNIHNSWLQHPRAITFLVSNHSNFVVDTGADDWLENVKSWPAYPHLSCTVIRSR